MGVCSIELNESYFQVDMHKIALGVTGSVMI